MSGLPRSVYATNEVEDVFERIRLALRHPNPLVREYARVALSDLSAEDRAAFDKEDLESYLDRTVRVVA